MSLVTVNYLQHPLVSLLLPFIYFTLTSRATASNYWAPLKDYCMMYRLPVSGSTGQWWDGNAGSCRCRQIPVSHPPVVQTGALSLLTRRLSCLTRAIRPSCCFFTLVCNCIFFFAPPFLFMLFIICQTPLCALWDGPCGYVQESELKSKLQWRFLCVKAGCVVLTKSVWRYCKGSVTCQISSRFSYQCRLAFHSKYCTLIPRFILQKLMWMPLTYAWKGSFWWSVKEMETFIWSMFHRRESFSRGYGCFLLFIRPTGVRLH